MFTTQELKYQAIAEYLLPQNLSAVAKKFHIGVPHLRKILREFNIPEHSAATRKYCAQMCSKQTCKEKYTVAYSFQSDNNKEKSKRTKQYRYGDINYNNPSKTRQTCLERYGVDSFLKTNSAAEKRLISNTKPLYVYHTICFDSFPELAFYLYHLYWQKNIIRTPRYFEYQFNGATYRYYPDFEVEGQFFEIKGNQFLKKDGTWQNPFDATQNALFEAKHQCALTNNVQILYKKDYQKYIDWFLKAGYDKNNFKPKLKGKNNYGRKTN